MAHDFTTPDGPDTRDGFLRYTYNAPNSGRLEDFGMPISFRYEEPPAETDLLPDDEYESLLKSNTLSRAYEYEVAVIGSGPAGRAAAVRASRLGAKVIMFEKDALGGLWLTAGSIPSNVYLKDLGAEADFKEAFSLKNSIVNKLTAGQARLLRSHRVRVEAGEAILKSAHEVLCRGRVYTASKVILCGGTNTDPPDISGLSHPGVFTIEKLFELSEVPPRLLILGGGYEGCELATVFARFGSNVMLIETGPQLLAGWDKEIAEVIEKSLMDAGVKVHTGTAVKDIVDRSGNPFVVTERGGVLCDKVLLATGRKPDLSALSSLRDAIEIEDGAVIINEYMETSLPGVFAAGDIAGLGYQTHASARMAETAASNAMGEKRILDLWAVPFAVFTSPEAAFVGLTEEEAREKYGDQMAVGYCSFSDNVRAMISGKTEGFVKVLAGRKHGEIFGVHITGAGAAEMIGIASAVMRMEVTVHEIINDIMHAHPTYMEAFAEACADALGGGK
jgi:dihydrolipoamide dehydrogenase